MKGLSATIIHRELVNVLRSNAIAYSTIPKHLRSASFKAKVAGSDERPGDRETNLTDDQILHVLETSPFASVSHIARMTLLPKTALYQHFLESLNFVKKKLRWVPPTLSEEQKPMRVEKSNELLQTLISMKHHSWRYILTLDESWFYLPTDYESIWFPS
jgi:hypothetical protein